MTIGEIKRELRQLALDIVSEQAFADELRQDFEDRHDPDELEKQLGQNPSPVLDRAVEDIINELQDAMNLKPRRL